MTYSACDFMDDITGALNVSGDPDGADDQVADIAELALAEIARLQKAAQDADEAISVLRRLLATLEGEWADPAAYGMPIENPDHNHHDDMMALRRVIAKLPS
jgi:hypothetical protein